MYLHALCFLYMFSRCSGCVLLSCTTFPAAGSGTRKQCRERRRGERSAGQVEAKVNVEVEVEVEVEVKVRARVKVKVKVKVKVLVEGQG